MDAIGYVLFGYYTAASANKTKLFFGYVATLSFQFLSEKKLAKKFPGIWAPDREKG